MAGPDLTAARAGAENLMDDVCRITRDPEGKTDSTLDPVTLKFHGPGPGTPEAAPLVIYDASTTGTGGRALSGKCRIRVSTLRAGPDREGGSGFVGGRYFGSIPWDAPELRQGDLVEIVAASRDPQLVGKLLIIREVLYKAYLSARQFQLELRLT